MKKRRPVSGHRSLDIINDLSRREARAKGWFKRITRRWATVAEFCAAHRLPVSSLCRWMNGTRIPRQPAINKVEAALEKDGL